MRCPWAAAPVMHAYHDREWGVPVHEDRVHFEFLTLEGAQAGLSWQTILAKRDRYREVLDEFDPERIAKYGARKHAALMKDPGIVRNRLKIESLARNARAFLEVREEFGSFDAYILALRGWPSSSERAQEPREDPRAHRRVRRDQQGPQTPRIQFRGQHDLLRLHASRGPRERSPRELLPLRTAGSGGPRLAPQDSSHRGDLMTTTSLTGCT